MATAGRALSSSLEQLAALRTDAAALFYRPCLGHAATSQVPLGCTAAFESQCVLAHQHSQCQSLRHSSATQCSQLPESRLFSVAHATTGTWSCPAVSHQTGGNTFIELAGLCRSGAKRATLTHQQTLSATSEAPAGGRQPNPVLSHNHVPWASQRSGRRHASKNGSRIVSEASKSR